MQIDRYRVLRTAAEGRFGPVLQAMELGPQKLVAVRVLSQVREPQRPTLQILQTFVQTLRQLALPGTEAMLTAGQLPDGKLYLVSEWIEGAAPQPGQLSEDAVLQLASQVVACLSAAHGHGLAHLHLHPQSILIVPRGASRLTCSVSGIGLAQLLGAPETALSAERMSCQAPEQRSGSATPVTAAADVYAVGALVARLLGGLPPGRVHSAVGELLGHMQAEDPARRPTLAEVSQQLSSLAPAGTRKLLDRLGRLAGKPPPRKSPDSRMVTTARLAPDSDRTVPSPQPYEATEIKETAELPRSPRDPLIGQLFGSFRLVRRIGSGGMGAVYEGEHQRIGHRAAVKVLHPQFASREEFARRFLDEARAVNIVRHPGLVSIYDYGERPDGRLFIVMEFLSGQPLDVMMSNRSRPLSEAEALPLARQLARALAVAHEGGIVHRDLKPSNIMLTIDPVSQELEQVKILDFGIAKVAMPGSQSEDHTQTGIAMGTPRYMAPEQHYDAGAVDGRADVFALGVVLYELLTLKSPFGDSGAPLMPEKEPHPLRRHAAVSLRLSRLVESMLQVSPRLRPSMAKVRDELERIAPAGAWRVRSGLAAGALLAAGGLVALQLWHRGPELAEMQSREARIRSRCNSLLQGALGLQNPIELRKAAILGLSEQNSPYYRPWLMPLLEDPSDEVVQLAADALAAVADGAVVARLKRMLDDSRWQRRRIAALAMASLKSQRDSEPGRSRLREYIDSKSLSGPAQARQRLALALRLFAASPAEYRERVWSELEQAELSPQQRLPVLDQLARKEEPRALAAIRQLAAQAGDAETRLRALGLLEQLGRLDATQEEALARTARQPGPQQQLSAWLLSRLGDEASCRFLSQLVQQRRQPEEARRLAASGLSHCRFEEAEVMAPLLDDAASDRSLRILYAASLLHVMGPEPIEVAAAQWQAVNDLMHSELASDRLLAISELSDIDRDESIDLLSRALSDREEAVRQAAAQSLGRKRAHRALVSLIPALRDANTLVRQEGLQAILKLLQALRSQQGPSAASTSAALHELLDRAQTSAEEILARLALLESGDRTQLAQLRRLRQGATDDQKLLIVELAQPDSELVREVLNDSSASDKVRFFAAKRRALIGARDSIPVLREMLGRHDEAALMAYWLLRGLGEHPGMPAQISDLLGRSYPVYTRVDVVRLLGTLGDKVATAEVLPLLQRALRDPAELVRAEVAQSASQLYKSRGALGCIELLQALMSDPEPHVRTRTAALLAELLPERRADRQPAPAVQDAGAALAERPPAGSLAAASSTDAGAVPSQAAQPIPDAGTAPAAAAPSETTARLTLNFAASLSVRIEQSDGRFRADAVSGRPLTLPSGRYRLLHPCGPSALILAPGAVRTQTVECTGEQLLQRAQTLRKDGRLSEANQSLDLARQLARQKGAPVLRDRIDFEEGDLKAASGNLPGALNAYQSVWDRKHAAQVPSIDEKFNALKGQVGRLTIRYPQNGSCVTIYDQLYMPGKISIPVGGVQQSYRIVAGGQLIDDLRCKQPSMNSSRK